MKKYKLCWMNISIIGIVVASNCLAISCSTITNKENDDNSITSKLNEEEIINNLDAHSKLTDEEKNEYKKEQQNNFSSLSVDNINDFLLENANMDLESYFINLNNSNKLKPNDPLYINPSLGIQLVDDVINGKILTKDIDNILEDYKTNNHEEYIDTLNNLNLTEEQVEDSKNIENVINTDKEEVDINNEFSEIVEENEKNPEVPEELDELFKLNDLHNENDVIQIDFYRDGDFYEYRNYDQLETRYIDEYSLYFDEPITVTIEMSDGTKIDIKDFDISELEYNYDEYGFLWCERQTKIYYRDNVIYRCYRDWWKDAWRDISKIYYKFHKLSTKINENDSKFISRRNNDTYTLTIDEKTYDSIYRLEKKIETMQGYYERSRILNDASWVLSGVAYGVAATWTATAFISFGTTAPEAAAATVQAISLSTTAAITESELKKTKKNLDKYKKLYDSEEYDTLIGLLNSYNEGNPNIPIKDKIEITIKAFYDYYQIRNYWNDYIEISDLKIIKKVNNLFNKPNIVHYGFDKINSMLRKFKNNMAKCLFKISKKVSRKFYTKLQNVFVKEMAEKLVCLSTIWANPITLVIDSFDLLFTVIDICNDIFYEFEQVKK